ncbi:MAG: hypothetical protein IJQ82_15335 [Selenomonadaceae bacterium]|nr:hypothetical protein [Selenomonadaceae bacterium]
MPLIDSGSTGIRPIDRQRPTEGTDRVRRRDDGGGGFRPQTTVNLKTAIQDIAATLGKIGTEEKYGIQRLPKEVGDVVKNILKQSLSLEATLGKGIGSTVESQRFSMDQLMLFSRMLLQIGTLAEKGYTMKLSEYTQTFLSTFKEAIVAEAGGDELEPILMTKAAFELVDAKTAEQLPEALYEILSQLAQTPATYQQQQPQSESMQFLKQLVKYFMPRPEVDNLPEQQMQQQTQTQQGQQPQGATQRFLESMFRSFGGKFAQQGQQGQFTQQNIPQSQQQQFTQQNIPQGQQQQFTQQNIPQGQQQQFNQQNIPQDQAQFTQQNIPQGQQAQFNQQNIPQGQQGQFTQQNIPQGQQQQFTQQNIPQGQQGQLTQQNIPQGQQGQFTQQNIPQGQQGQFNQQNIPQGQQGQFNQQNIPQGQQGQLTQQNIPQGQQGQFTQQNIPQGQQQFTQQNIQQGQQGQLTQQNIPQGQGQFTQQNIPQGQQGQFTQQNIPQGQQGQFTQQNIPQGQQGQFAQQNIPQGQQQQFTQPIVQSQQAQQAQQSHGQANVAQSQRTQIDPTIPRMRRSRIKPKHVSEDFVNRQEELRMQMEMAKNAMLKQNLQNTPQTNDTMKSLAQFLLRNPTPNSTPRDMALLQNFINNSQSMMSEDEARHLQNLLRLCQNNIPLTVRQAAVQQNLPDLPRLWAFMQMCDMANVTSKMNARAFKRAGKDVADFTTSMRHAMSAENSVVQNQRSFQMMLPLYMGDNEASYPTYLNVYDENTQDEETGENKKETWFRICVLTDYIGAAELVFRVYDETHLDMRFYFSRIDIAEEFRSTYLDTLRNSLKQTELNVGEVRVGGVGERMFSF